MPKQVLLDTNAAIARINGDQVLEQLLKDASEIFVPVIVLGELYYGAENSAKVQDNLEQVESFRRNVVALNCDVDTAQEFGRLAHEQRLKGQMIPDNDMWIAAIARQHNLIVISRDKHFESVDDLTLESW
ncbi:MAG: type II toxin-antitoxin system VapC family toxin [Anaerolineae bacterium]|nr:type II toxin-antitoxin system VapC family toxin [Anaerolineae bacterium]